MEMVTPQIDVVSSGSLASRVEHLAWAEVWLITHSPRGRGTGTSPVKNAVWPLAPALKPPAPHAVLCPFLALPETPAFPTRGKFASSVWLLRSEEPVAPLRARLSSASPPAPAPPPSHSAGCFLRGPTWTLLQVSLRQENLGFVHLSSVPDFHSFLAVGCLSSFSSFSEWTSFPKWHLRCYLP